MASRASNQILVSGMQMEVVWGTPGQGPERSGCPFLRAGGGAAIFCSRGNSPRLHRVFLKGRNKPLSCLSSCEELTHWKRLWRWEGLGAGGEGDNRGWDGWMASPTRWTWVWANSWRWRWTGRPGVLWFTGSQRAGHDWAAELNWTDWGGAVCFSSLKLCPNQ